MKDKVVLILDDEYSVARTAALAVEKIGYEVLVSTAATEFFCLLEKHKPDYILLDLLMPDMDGVEVFIELAKRSSTAKIIILSGAETTILHAARITAIEHHLNVLGVVAKPYILDSLRQLLLQDSEDSLNRFVVADEHKIAGEVNDPSYIELFLALQRSELFVVYQPKISCQSGEVVGFEALVRWQHPLRGLVMPDHFIPLAEASDLINPLTRYVASEAFDWFAENFLDSEMHLAINVSARNLMTPNFADELAFLCLEHNVDTRRIVCEITETSMMEDSLDFLDALTRLRLKGLQLSIDDFGTGFSSMERLAHLPFSEIKVDKSFVLQSSESLGARSVIESIIDLGKAIGLRSSAEGVEDWTSVKMLRDLNCDILQGYFISKPMTHDVALQWMRDYDPTKFNVGA